MTQPTVPVDYEDLRLDELLRIMDAATTLRKERETAAVVLESDETRAQLRDKLMATAAASGEELTPAEVDAAIERYYDALHEFPEPEARFQVLLAKLYIRRGLVLTILGVLAAWVALALFLFVLPGAPFSSKTRERRAMEEAFEPIERARVELTALAAEPATDANILRLVESAEGQRAAGDVGGVETTARQLELLGKRLRDQFTLEVAAPTVGESAVALTWEDGRGRREAGYYLIVEAKGDGGGPVKVRIRDAQTGAESDVSRWAELVPEAVYQRLKDDKLVDGVLDEVAFGVKRRGTEELEVLIPDADGTPVVRRRQLVRW